MGHLRFARTLREPHPAWMGRRKGEEDRRCHPSRLSDRRNMHGLEDSRRLLASHGQHQSRTPEAHCEDRHQKVSAALENREHQHSG